MSILLVLNQPLRLPRAISYAAQRDGVQKLIMTSDSSNAGSLPRETLLITFDDLDVAPPSSHGGPGRAVVRAERWVKDGSSIGAKVGRWIRAAEWRLRHLNRVRSILEHRRGGDATSHHTSMLLALESITASYDIEEIVVFDLFDLPPVLEFAEPRDLVVKIR